MSFLKTGIPFACILAALPLKAQPSVVITLPSVADRVRAQNPDLAAARLRISEALGRAKQSGRPANPELDTTFEHNTRFNEGRIEVGVSQRFPVTDRLHREKAFSLASLRAAENEVRDVERKLIAEASRATVEVLAIRERKRLLTGQTELAGRLAENISRAAEKGEGSSLDAGQARIEAIRSRTESRALDAEEAAAIGVLKPLLGLRPDEGLVISGSLPAPVLPVSSGDPARRPDYQAARIGIEAADEEIAIERAKRYDDVTGGIFAGAEREDSRNEAIVGLRFSVPLPFWDRNEGGIEEAEARRRRKQLEAAALANTIRHEADAARAEMREWAALAAEIGNELLPAAVEQAEQTEAAFNNGQTDIQTVLRARAQRLELAATRIDALRGFHLARVRHQAATGAF